MQTQELVRGHAKTKQDRRSVQQDHAQTEMVVQEEPTPTRSYSPAQM